MGGVTISQSGLKHYFQPFLSLFIIYFIKIKALYLLDVLLNSGLSCQLVEVLNQGAALLHLRGTT